MKNKLHIILLNYNNPLPTIDLVESITQQKNIDLSIIVVDNCSPDNSYSLLCDALNTSDQIDVIKANRNGGYASGNNFGLNYIKNIGDNDYVAILNNDLIIDDELLFSKLIEEYNKLIDVAFVAPAQKDQYGHIYSNSAWKKPSFFQDLMMSFWIYRKFVVSNTYDLSKSENIIPVEILPGSFILSSYRYFKSIDFFDEGTFLFLEERILFDKTIL